MTDINSTSDTIVGLFEDQRTAQAVVDDLLRAGFRSDEVNLSSSSNYASDAASGGSALTGRAPAEHHGSGFMGWLNSVFGGDEEFSGDSTRYSEAVQRGGYVVAVSTNQNKREQAVEIMNDHGAVDVDEHAAKYNYAASESVPTATSRDTGTGGTIPVVQEELQVGKRAVQRGGVRVYSKVVEQPVEQDVQLREEKVTVERRPVNRPLTDADRNSMRDQTIEVTEMAEEAVISKQPRVVEEVRIGKESRDRTQTVRDSVRRTEVTTENLGGGQNANYTDDFRRDFQTRYGSTGSNYETYAPAYDYGYRMAGDSRYEGRDWNEVESTLKTDYLRNNPNSTWDQAKGAVRYGWEKVTGQR